MSPTWICFVLFLLPAALAITCADGFSCYQDNSTGIVWTLAVGGNLYGPTCSEVCNTGLCGTGSFYGCNPTQSVLRGSSFAPVANGLGFTCTTGSCWDGVSSSGMMWVKSGANLTSRSCYFPNETTYSCSAVPGNANCFGERYSTVCPCKTMSIDNQACTWQSPPNYPATATWSVSNPNSTSCIDRINYWRKKACDDKWPECPPCGLPPMVECVGCHQCANSQAEYDSTHGAHASFTRCGENVQGEGGGANCMSLFSLSLDVSLSLFVSLCLSVCLSPSLSLSLYVCFLSVSYLSSPLCLSVSVFPL